MKNILVFNAISDKGLSLFPKSQYYVSDAMDNPDAIIVRSHKLHDYTFDNNILCVGRAGAGVNNIPVAKLTELGIPVFNTPGANANAVKELVLTGMLLASRNICQAWQYVGALTGEDAEISVEVEKGKKQFRGVELPGRTLAVIGLGSIGVKVANAAVALGMRVIGFDPKMTIQNAWQLSSKVESATSIDAMLAQADFISLHVPLNEHTKGLMNASRFAKMKPGSVLLNFARDVIVEEGALLEALGNKLTAYVCDFPSKSVIGHDKVIALPHLGASTVEAEENCAVMVANQLRDYLENGSITNSVNFPTVDMPRIEDANNARIAIANHNVPNMVAQISTVLADAELNIVDLINKSRDDIAYTLIDVHAVPNDATLQALQAIDGVVSVRLC